MKRKINYVRLGSETINFKAKLIPEFFFCNRIISVRQITLLYEESFANFCPTSKSSVINIKHLPLSELRKITLRQSFVFLLIYKFQIKRTYNFHTIYGHTLECFRGIIHYVRCPDDDRQ